MNKMFGEGSVLFLGGLGYPTRTSAPLLKGLVGGWAFGKIVSKCGIEPLSSMRLSVSLL